jgi:hypothetical protein
MFDPQTPANTITGMGFDTPAGAYLQLPGSRLNSCVHHFKKPLAFAFSNRMYRPAFEGGFLAAKSIILIKIKSFFTLLFLSPSNLTSERCESLLIQPLFPFIHWVKAKLFKTFIFLG